MKSHASMLRDFTVDTRVVFLSLVAGMIGIGSAGLAVVLLRSIVLATNLFYFHRFSLTPMLPAQSPLGHLMFAVPVLGGLIVGLMARYGSDKIRGHGIPEAIEAILLRGARVDPRVALLKPLSAAIAIGSGGPFGAEGPIIMTGGAFGSLVAQWLNLTDAERTTLLVAGAAAGMSATFSTPLAAVLLAVELLLFEWRPRSLVPVAAASVTAGVLRVHWLGDGPLFPMPGFSLKPDLEMLLLSMLFGAGIGLASTCLSRLMYSFEDLFGRLPVHWMWWPAIGGIGVGVGGLFFPRGLGVGYDNIAELLRGNAPLALIVGVLLGKSLMWAFSLGSGTSGGVLAPLLMIGGALGSGAAYLAHASVETTALWTLVGMGAMLSGSLGAPLTAIVFSLELTHCLPALTMLLPACIAAHAVTSLIMPRSILTEKLSRRGYHLTREYGVDPLESIIVMEVMQERESSPASDALPEISLPYVFADETCRSAAEQMATSGQLVLSVIDRESNLIVGIIDAASLLQGRRRAIKRESERSRIFTVLRRAS